MWTLDKIKALCKSIGVKEAVEIVAKDIGKTKALAIIDGQELVDADGNPVDIQTISLETGGGEEEEEETEEEVTEEAQLSADKRMVSLISKSVAEAMKEANKANKARSPINGEVHEQRVIPAKAMRMRVKNFANESGSRGLSGEYKAYTFGSVIAAATGSEYSKKWLVDQGLWQHPDQHGNLKAMIEGDNDKFGVFVPEELSSDIIQLIETFGKFRQETNVVQMTRDTLRTPRILSEGDANFIGENKAITETDDTSDSVLLTAKKLSRITKVSSELMEDAIISVGDQLARGFARKWAEKEDAVGYNGTGIGSDGGIVGITVKINDGNHAAGIHTALAANIGFDTFDLIDFQTMAGKLPEYAQANAKWHISNVGFWTSMARLSTSSATRKELEDGPQFVFEGYPVVIVQKLNSVVGDDVSKIKCLLGDLSMSSTLGERRVFSIKTDESIFFETDMIAVRGISRIDIVNHDLGDSSTAGPIIALKTPSS